MTSARVAVVGLGRLGTCLARALQHSGVGLTALSSLRIERVLQFTQAAGLDAQLAVPIERVCELADWIFLTVPDAQLESVSGRIPAAPGQLRVHCSGALDVSPLMAASAGGATPAVFHPLQSFGPNAPPERFAGVAIGIDASDPSFQALSQLAAALGARPFSLRGIDRARYHAAAVFASNYLVALHAVAARVWESAGLPRDTARAALAALSRGAVENVEAHALEQALTGPIARGDAATVARHLGALENDRPSLELYVALARELLQLPLDHGDSARAALEGVLAGAVEPTDRGEGVV